MRTTMSWRRGLGMAGLALVLAACGVTEPEPDQVMSQIVIPPIQTYSFSAIVNPGCQDTGYGINDANTKIGIACGAAFMKAADGTMTTLIALPSQGANGTANPTDINNNNRIVGYSYETGASNSSRAVQWFSVKGVMGVNTLGQLAGGTSSQAFGVNINADIAGWSEIAMAGGVIRKHGVLWRPGNVKVDLTPANCYHNAEAYDVNDQGFVVGVSYTPIAVSACNGIPSRQATLWKPAGSGSNTYAPIALVALNSSEARAINNLGDIAGTHRSTATGGNTNLSKWKVNTSNWDIISPSDPYTVPEDINNNGLIVGERRVSGVSVAFAYGTNFATLPTPVTTQRAFAMGVNSCGNVAGEGHQLQSNVDHQVAALWTKNGC